MPDIELTGVRKRYGDVVAVDGVDLAFRDDECHALVGPNGSGKTTLLRLVLGLTPASGGEIRVPDDRTVGCAFQTPSFYPALTVAENLDTFGAFVGADDEWLAEVTDRLGLDVVRGRVAGDLSGGFARKLDLALAVAREPDVLLLDEPLGALDDVTRDELVAFLADYRDAGHGVVVSTHDLAAFGPTVDRVTVVRDGRQVATAHVTEIDSPQAFCRATFAEE
ncbi:ABC transporter ATP-binding protein [Halorarius litoreus]|uniref:ABC transporter ATP-binding protein n=1 Tax=Halorarius litoreus TaxID=2962676 RepID=UPI0020CBD601|nr:ABC transporter ATP-binding protein [Halorarius litoreus]